MFDPEMVEDLPAPVRRFLLRAIAAGTPLADSVQLEMHGTLRLAPDRDPVPFVAEQLLAPPERFVWRARTTGGLFRIRGFDRYGEGKGEMRWRLWGLIPVVRADGYTVPSRIEAGWSLGEVGEFRFFEATLDRARFR